MPSTKSQIAKLLEPAPPVESLIAEGFNEKLGNSETATLLPLDAGTLEVICRLNLPGVPLERLSVSESFLDEPLGFQQVVSFSCGTGLRPFQVAITQCDSHVDAIKAMKRALCGMTYVHDARGLEAVKNKKLGNYAVKSKDETAVIWTRWTTVVEVGVPFFRSFHDKPSSVDIQALAAAIDSAMKAHKGTICEVPWPNLDEDFEIPNFKHLHQSETIEVKFEDGIHHIREYRVIQDENACVVKDDLTPKYVHSDDAGGRFCSELEIIFHKKYVPVTIVLLMAHKSSLWPFRHEFIFHDLVCRNLVLHAEDDGNEKVR